jgi:hypothetical protein
MTPLGEFWPYLVLILAGFLPNGLWRMLGVIIGHGVDENSELIIWVRAVAIALLAGVIARIVVVPPSALATIAFSVRLAAIGCGFAAYVAARQSVFAGVLVGEAVLVIGAMI